MGRRLRTTSNIRFARHPRRGLKLASPDKVDPIHQFEVYELIPIRIGGLDLSFTNASLFMVVTVVLASAWLYFTTASRGLVPGRAQSVSEVSYEFIANMLRDAAGQGAMRYFPFVFTLFAFIFVANMLGMFPYFFTVTSHIVVTAALALTVILLVIAVGLRRNGLRFLKLFVPSGVPPVLLLLVVPIEIISFIARPVSLSVRLFANMAGHITLKVFAGFVVSMSALGVTGIIGAILPLIMTVGITALEFLVAFLQAYVFTMLTCMYINDALHPDGH
jgi:F-type H+-transporting ATPase subunit a